MPLKLFISYSHEDEKQLKELLRGLRPLERDGTIEPWTDHLIDVGEDWKAEIQAAIDDCDLALFLVSTPFLASEFIHRKELKPLFERAKEDGVRLVPILLRPCDWENSTLKGLQTLPGRNQYIEDSDSRRARDKAWLAVTDKIRDWAEEADSNTGADASLPSRPMPRLSVEKLPTTNSEFFGRENEFATLDQAFCNEQTNLVTVTAWGGAGKTALVNQWLNRIASYGYHGANRVYAWSFYNHGTPEGEQASVDEFLGDALAWFDDPDATIGNAWDKGTRLAELIRKERTLLILDGVEVLQYAAVEQQGRVRAQGLQAVLRSLARSNTGLCVLTSRLRVADVDAMVDSSVQVLELQELSVHAGVKLLTKLGVRGSQEELQETVREYQGHPLSLTLLGRYLSVVHYGDVQKRESLEDLTKDPRQGGKAQRVMASYASWLKEKPEQLSILFLFGLFDRPVSCDALRALRSAPPIKGLTTQLSGLSESEWLFSLQALRDLRLLPHQDVHEGGNLDCHPLIREYFGRRLREQYPSAWLEAHSILFDYYKDQAPPKPDNLEDMRPLFMAVFHGCQAGRYANALRDVYYERISRRDIGFLTKKLGAYSAETSILSNFFDRPWSRPVDGLSKGDRGSLWNWVGNSLRAQGRLHESAEAFESGKNCSISLPDWEGAAIDCQNLSEVQLLMGNIEEAIGVAEQGIEFEVLGNEISRTPGMRVMLANALHQAARLDEAETLFHEAEISQEASKPYYYDILYGVYGYLYSELLLTQGQYEEVLRRAKKTIDWAESGNLGLLPLALNKLSLAQAYQMQSLREGSNHYTDAVNYINEALQQLRGANALHYLPRALVARAALYREMGQFRYARLDLDEMKAIVEQSEMRILAAEYFIESTRLSVVNDDKARARTELVKAKALIDDMQYRRRAPELEQLCGAVSGEALEC